jgi:hypothetical protein
MRLKEPLIKTINNIPKKPRKELSNVAIHDDPDFATFTYGDIPPKGRKCNDLEPGDLLVFCTCLQDYGNRRQYHRVFIIGCFTVEATYDFEEISTNERKDVISKYKNKNAQFSSAFARSWGGTREELLDTYVNKPEAARLVLVVGRSTQKGVRVSGLFKRAIRLTEKVGGESCYIPAKVVRSLGLRETQGRLLYEIGSKWVNWDRNNMCQIEELRKILAKGEGFC